MAVKLVLNPIFSPCAIDSSVVPVFEHSIWNFSNSESFLKYFEIGWSTDKAKNESPKSVSGLVVKTLILSRTFFVNHSTLENYTILRHKINSYENLFSNYSAYHLFSKSNHNYDKLKLQL